MYKVAFGGRERQAKGDEYAWLTDAANQHASIEHTADAELYEVRTADMVCE